MSSVAPRVKRLSGLQRQVLSVYRLLLKAADKKEKPDTMKQYIRQQFRLKAQSIPVHNHYQIEWFVRYAKGQLETISSPHCTNITFMTVKTERDPSIDPLQEQKQRYQQQMANNKSKAI